MTAKPKRDHWVGFDLGGTKMQANVFDADFQTVGRARKKTKAHLGLEVGLDRIAKTIADALEQAMIDPDRVAAIGMGSPGPLDLDRGLILDTPNLGWKQAPLKQFIEKTFGCPTTVINDVDAGVYGEYRFGAARKARCVVGIFPGTGIGGGAVYEGQLIRGAVTSVMEIGHMTVSPNGPRCGCGKYGCLEAVASRLVIASAVAAAAHRGDAPTIWNAAGTDIANIRSGLLADAIRAGDAVVEQIVRDAARWCGVALGSVVNLLGPDIILLGGGLVEAMPQLYKEAVSAGVADHIMSSFDNAYKVVVAKLGDDATAMGAAGWAEAQVTGRRG